MREKKREHKAEGIMLLDLKLYYKVTVIEQYGISINIYRSVNRREQRAQEKTSHIYGQLIYDNRAKDAQW